MTGWCADNPQRLKVAKRANAIVNDWSISDLGDRITSRAYNRIVANRDGWLAGGIPDQRPINVHLLFARV